MAMTELINIEKKAFVFGCSFFIVLLMEFFLFHTYVLREIAPYYPSNSDQAGYLATTYQLYEDILKNGLFHASVFAPTVLPTSMTFSGQVAIFFLFVGGERFTALLFGFFCFALLQLMAVNTLLFFTRNYFVATLFIGLLLLTAAPFYFPGGMCDFRIDFIALCLYGIFITCVIRSEIFLNTQWTIIATLLAVWLVLTRTIAVVYIGQIVFLMILICIFMMYYARKRRRQLLFLNSKVRLKNLVFFSTLFSIIILPLLWLIRHLLYGYYIVGHVTGDEPMIRMLEQGVTNFLLNLLFYPRSVVVDHLGYAALLFVIILGISIIYSRFRRYSSPLLIDAKRDDSLWLMGMLFLMLVIVIPIVTLTLDVSKSPIVGGIVVVPVLFLVIWVFIFFYKYQKNECYLKVLAMVFCLAGVCHWLANFGKHVQGVAGNVEMGKMYQDIGNYAQKVGWHNIVLSTDHTVDYLGVNILKTFYYEKYATPIYGEQTHLGATIFAMDKQAILEDLSKSNVFIINLNDTYPYSIYPFNQIIKQQLRNPLITAIIEENFSPLKDYNFLGSKYRVYVKPAVGVSGLSGEWITSEGIVLEIPNVLLRSHKISQINLMGDSNAWISSDVSVSAYFERQGKKVPLNASLIMLEGHYNIAVAVPKDSELSRGITKIYLSFSNYFVPNQIGMNEDTRKLVFMGPYKKDIVEAL